MRVEDKFKKWLIDTDKSEKTAYNYAKAINRISKHYSETENIDINIYQIKDFNYLNKIKNLYSQNGKYKEFGNKGNATNRNAIARYLEFFANNYINKEVEINIEDIISQKEIIQSHNFSYEKDLKTSLLTQIDKLFPDYRIFGLNSEGIEYIVENRRIDILLEHKITNSLLVVELKANKADYKVFGQISMYIGLLKDKFPNRDIKGIIIANLMDNSLKQAVKSSNNIKLQTYNLNIVLENS